MSEAKKIYEYTAAGNLTEVDKAVASKITEFLNTTKDSNGWTFLMHASQAGHLPIIQYLLRSGVNINDTNLHGNTALHFACSSDLDSSFETVHPQISNIIKTLIANGADETLINEHKNTPFDYAKDDIFHNFLIDAVQDKQNGNLQSYIIDATQFFGSRLEQEAAYQQLQAQFNEQQQQIQQLQQQIQQQQATIASNSAAIITLEESLKSTTTTLTTVREEKSKLEQEKKSLVETFESFQKESHEKIENLINQLSSLANSKTELESQIGEKTKEAEEKSKKIDSIQNQLNKSNETNQLLQQELANSKNSINNNNSGNNGSSNNTSLPRFSVDVLKIATNYFSEQNKLGAGSFGDVYKGSHLQTLIAVKRLKLKESQTTQFQAELVSLSRFRHPNIISILGYSDDGVEKCLVYEFAPNGSLRDRLDRKDNSLILIWSQRESIAMGIAIGMNYLQNADPHSPFFHLDLKSANVLLDHHLVPKIADFGLAKPVIIPNSSKDSNVYTSEAVPVGDGDYICPEYLFYGKVSRKTDVYSYGCILMELLTGKKSNRDLIVTIRGEHAKKGNLRNKLDKTLDLTEKDFASVDIVVQVCIQCIQQSRLERPSFTKIIETLLNKSVLLGDIEEHDCTVCSDAPINSVFKPCNHAVMCQNCAERWIGQNNNCPVCHSSVIGYAAS